ncbi:MAG: hypothetical protein CMI27_04170 [Opitutae bacterium]|nr:hypothetical protein [Opitutae bacterium]
MSSVSDLVYPLSLMRMARKLPRLNFTQIETIDIPEPYLGLLVHEGDMTSRLEGYHKKSIRVRCLRSSNDGKSYFREVILETEQEARPAEYGAIEIQLNSLPEEVRKLVVEARQPLGGILNDSRIPYSSSPKAFLSIIPDGPIIEAFGTVEADILYGRSNEISGLNGDCIARIVEILPVLEE